MRKYSRNSVATRPALEKRCRRQHQHKGMALITAVLVAALITSAAVTMATTHRFSIQRGFNQLNGTMVEHGVRALESDIVNELVSDNSLNAVDSLNEQWASEEWVGDQPNVQTSARVIDMQARFNLQNLAFQFGSRAFRDHSATARAAISPVTNDETTKSVFDSETSENGTFSDTASQPSSPASELTRDQIDAFDFSNYQQFIDSYVNSCAGENQKCTREAIALVLQQTQSANDEESNDTNETNPSSTTERNPNENFDSTERTPNGPPSGVASGANAKSDGAIDSEAQLSALFRALDLDLEPVQAILDWIDQDSETRYPNGAEDEYYTALDEPYRAANGPFVTVRELLLVRGVTLEIYNKLAPHLNILPQATPININTAGPDVLMAIHPMIDRTTAELLIDSRKAQPFQTVKAFVEHPALLGLSIPLGLLSTRSEYFLIRSTASSAGLQTHHQAILKRTNLTTSAVRRSRGYFN